MPKPAPASSKVLVIDDDEQCLNLTARLLRTAGYEVTTRSNPLGSSAAVGAVCPDLVLIDLNMPLLDGDRLVPLLRRAVSDPLLVVLHSGMADRALLRQRASACGADAVIPKGLPPGEFLAHVARLFGPVPS
jgi:CheY-like chemotaxis protein